MEVQQDDQVRMAIEIEQPEDGKVVVEGMDDEGIPDDVTTKEQLALVPECFLSNDPKRPLQYEVGGRMYKFALKPMFYSTIFILLVEALERLSYYGVSYTATAYLTGQYENSTGGTMWSANLSPVEASSWVSTSTAIAYATPFVGAIVADALLGNYLTIALGASLLYLPGLLLIALTAYPELLGPTFPTDVLAVGFLGLYSCGAGVIKSVVNVFGAQQYHPVLQRSLIDIYYVRFYMCINIGALIGGITIPIVVQTNAFAAYMIPVVGLSLCIIIFLLGTTRYVRYKPEGKDTLDSVAVCGRSLLHCPPSLNKEKKTNGGKYDVEFIENVKMLLSVFPITGLIVFFNVGYAQMSTTFIVQGTAMASVGVIDSSMMQNFDAISVLFFAWIVGSYFYPYLAKRNIHLATTTKFAIGSALAAVALLCSIIVDYQIHYHWNTYGEQISVLWQAPQYILIGAGEIFAISSAYAAAFEVAPSSQKALASAINLFLIGTIPNLISTAVLNGCKTWAFTTSTGGTNLKETSAYADANVYRFLWVLFAIVLFGVVLNLLPPVKRGIISIEEKARSLAEKESLDSTEVPEAKPQLESKSSKVAIV